MKIMTVKKTEVPISREEYDESVVLNSYSYGGALKEVLRIRDQRQLLYADDWKEQADWELLALLKVKIKRLEHFIIDKKDQGLYENINDCYVDLINYSLFALQNNLDRGKK